MTEPVLTVAHDGAVTTISLNRPHTKNALNAELVEALGAALGASGRDPAVRVVVLTGAGGAFCAGADLKAGLQNIDASEGLERALDAYHTIIRAIVGAPKPVIAMVDGPAVGFGCDLALACDLRFASTDAYFQEKFVRIGLMPDGGGTFFLPRLIGLARAMEIVLTGEAVPAPRALELGLVNRVVAPAALAGETMALARRLAEGPPLAFAEIKRAMIGSLSAGIDAALASEKEGQLRCLRSADCMEGVLAWMEKRAPVFHGK